LIDNLESEISCSKLNYVEKKLLKFIALSDLEGRNLLVSDCIYANKIASPATFHTRISRLQKLGLIRHGPDSDLRKMYSQGC